MTSERLREAMIAEKVDQVALARELGVSQSTISKMVTGRTVNSRLMPRVARRVRRSLPYLLGETDDPGVDGPGPAELSGDENEMVDLIRGLDPDDRAVLLQLARRFATSARSPTVHAGGQKFRGQGRR